MSKSSEDTIRLPTAMDMPPSLWQSNAGSGLLTPSTYVIGFLGTDGRLIPFRGLKFLKVSTTSSKLLGFRRTRTRTSTRCPSCTGTRYALTLTLLTSGRIRFSSLYWYSSVRSSLFRSGSTLPTTSSLGYLASPLPLSDCEVVILTSTTSYLSCSALRAMTAPQLQQLGDLIRPLPSKRSSTSPFTSGMHSGLLASNLAWGEMEYTRTPSRSSSSSISP
mmetsp:Transcript_9379/g.32630  ORF Transcript_9379/g.32630 Transcript_9379/m.32630 type:complete len:219 (+) Transcript_9379:409-1065(+)